MEIFRESFEEDQHKYEEQLKNSATFKMNEDKLATYKTTLSNLIPSELTLSDNHFRLMKFWETEDNDKFNAGLLSVNKLLNHDLFTVDHDERTTHWRKEYLQKLVEQSKNLREIDKQVAQLERKRTDLARHYGIKFEDFPLQIQEKKIINPLSSIISQMFRKNE